MPTKKKSSPRKKATTAAACKSAGGRPIKFKGKKEIVCFPKAKKSSSKKKSSGAKKGKGRSKVAARRKACVTMAEKGFRGNRKKFQAMCNKLMA
jgi:hypothetical protein